MTLVVAQATESGPRIVSDTRVTYHDGRRPSFREDVLKTIVIDSGMAVSFSGNLTAGLDSVRKVAGRWTSGAGVEAVVDDLHQAACSSAGAVDFIVARASAVEPLIRIRNEGIERGLTTTWLGDHHAFERFQAGRSLVDAQWGFVKATCSKAEYVMLTLVESMRAVISDPEITTVDAFCVAVASDSRAFNYQRGTFIYPGRDFVIQSGQPLLSAMGQPVEHGGYEVSIVPPLQPGTPALGLCFANARLGMVYVPLMHDEAQVIYDVAARDFGAVAHARYGVELEMPMRS